MKVLFTFLFSILSIGLSQAQTAGQGYATGTAGVSNNAIANTAIQTFLGATRDSDEKRKGNKYVDSNGSPYTSNKFQAAILYHEKEKIGDIYYRYNALNEEIEIKKNILQLDNYQALRNDKKISLIIQGHRMSFKTFVTSKNRTLNGYLTELINGKNYDLYKRITVKYTEGTPAQNSFVAAVPSRFTQFTEYYYQKKEVNRIDEIIAKNSKLLKFLNQKEKIATKTYIKENNINIKKEGDLIKVFEFLNSL